MAKRNPNWDKARFQAVGIYRKVSPQASINHGETQYSGGDYRTPEAAKACYHGKAEPLSAAELEAFIAAGGKVRYQPAFMRSGGRIDQPGKYSRKRGNCDQSLKLVPGHGYGRPTAKW